MVLITLVSILIACVCVTLCVGMVCKAHIHIAELPFNRTIKQPDAAESIQKSIDQQAELEKPITFDDLVLRAQQIINGGLDNE